MRKRIGRNASGRQVSHLEVNIQGFITHGELSLELSEWVHTAGLKTMTDVTRSPATLVFVWIQI